MELDSVALFLLSIAAIFLIGALGEVTFQRTNIPDVIWLILAGILLGPMLHLVTPDMLKTIAPYFAALTLVVVLFEGGTTLKLSELSQAAPRSSILALTSFVFAVFALTLASMAASFVHLLPATWTWSHGLLLGTILGGSSSIIIMPAMAQARLPGRLANLVNLESALTDAFCVVGTSAIIDIMMKGGAGANPGLVLLRSFGIGLSIGVMVGLVWLLFLRFLHSNEHAYPVTLSALLILYVVIDSAQGSAALGILTVAVMLGNAPLLGRFIGLKDNIQLDTGVRGFHRQMAFIVKSFFFVFIGAMLAPPWSLIATGVLFGGLLLVARIPAVRLSTLASGFTPAQKTMATIALPRGMAAGVLATLPMSAGVPGTEQLPVLVFAAVFTTILIFAVGFPMVKRRMPEGDRAADGEAVSLPAGAAIPSEHAMGPSASILRKADIPRAPRTGFEQGLLTGDSLEPDPRLASEESSHDLGAVPEGSLPRPEDPR
jgi:cell volume regulation protein A